MSDGVSGSRPAAKAGGFTLLQLMIVMAMITVLVAIGVSFLFRSNEGSRQFRTKALIQRLEVACQQYNQRYLSYPPSPGLSPKQNSASLFVQLCSPLNVACIFIVPASGGTTMYPPVMTDLGPSEVQGGFPSVGPGQMMPPRAIIDPWGNPIDYIRLAAGKSCPCRASLPVAPAGGHDHRSIAAGGFSDVDEKGRRNDPSFMDCRRTCDIESMGPPSFRGYAWDDNDIANWKPNRQ